MAFRTLHLLFIISAASVRCEPNFRWMLLDKGDHAEGTTFEIMNDDTMEKQNLRIMQSPCSCESLMCKCCAGFNFDQINFKREGCMVFGFDPMEFSIGMQITMNDKVMWNNSISGKNPPPMCIPIQIPGLTLPKLDMCMKLYDIYFPGPNVHMCMDMEPKLQGTTLMVLHFDCMRMGADGWAMMKPGDKVELTDVVDNEDTVYDTVYDETGNSTSSATSSPAAALDHEADHPGDPSVAKPSGDASPGSKS